jgi:hypothetical protein
VPGVVIENVETTDKTLPDFVSRWTRLLDSDADGQGGDVQADNGQGRG